LIPALIGASAWIMALIVQSSPAAGKPIAAALAFSLPILACFFTSKRHAAFGLAILSVMVVAQQSSLQLGSIQLRRRGFYGMHSVAVDQHAGLIKLLHGQTIHGGQYLDPAKSMAPTFYYHPQGPLGEAFQAIHARHDLESVALVGLGAGTALCYSEEGESWHLFEIDPEVEWIAKDSGYFSFLKNASAKWRIQLGDARITLNREKQSSFDFLIIDAFSSDVIPAHLLTKQAFTLYLSLIREDGFIAINVSNRHLNVDRVVAAVASHLGLTIIEKTDDLLNSGRKSEGTVASQWMLMQREEDESLGLLLEKGWMRPETDASYIWTDDFYDLIRIMK